jgi:predicted nucleic acid-binding protein
MPDKVFVDTNILLYAKIDDGSEKYTKSHDLLTTGLVGSEIPVSVQVLNEYHVNALRLKVPVADIQNTVRQFMSNFNVVTLTPGLVEGAMRIYNHYQLQYWDCLIVAAALEAGCSILYSEDMSDGLVIDGTLTVVNLFLHGIS